MWGYRFRDDNSEATQPKFYRSLPSQQYLIFVFFGKSSKEICWEFLCHHQWLISWNFTALFIFIVILYDDIYSWLQCHHKTRCFLEFITKPTAPSWASVLMFISSNFQLFPDFNPLIKGVTNVRGFVWSSIQAFSWLTITDNNGCKYPRLVAFSPCKIYRMHSAHILMWNITG